MNGPAVSPRPMAMFFIVGSSLFALGAIPWYAETAGLRVTALTFFAGSVFFTGGAWLQFRAAGAAVAAADGGGRSVVWAPTDPDWLAAVIQLAGTLWFNWSTANAVRVNLDAAESDQRVWRPDAFGSIAFLVSSALAWSESRRDLVPGRPRPRAWWIGVLNLLGSVAFGVSAVAAYVVPDSGDVWNAEVSNLGTLVGAVCFLAGAAMSLRAE